MATEKVLFPAPQMWTACSSETKCETDLSNILYLNLWNRFDLSSIFSNSSVWRLESLNLEQWRTLTYCNVGSSRWARSSPSARMIHVWEVKTCARLSAIRARLERREGFIYKMREGSLWNEVQCDWTPNGAAACLAIGADSIMVTTDKTIFMCHYGSPLSGCVMTDISAAW